MESVEITKIEMTEAEFVKLDRKLNKLFENVLLPKGVVERVDTGRDVIFQVVKGREDDFFGVMAFLMGEEYVKVNVEQIVAGEGAFVRMG